MKRLIRLLAAFAAAALLVPFAWSAPAGAASTVVHAGESIQQAIDNASPGDTIVVFRGTYAENLEITKDGIRLVGLGATLTPPATAIPNVCGDPSDPASVVGVCIHGDVSVDENFNVTVNSYVHDVSVTGFTVRDFPTMGIFAIGTQDTRLVGNKTLDDGEYGIFANTASGTQIIGNVATNGGEAGIYVGDSPEADARVVGNDVSGSAQGVFVRNAEHGSIVGNRLHDNCIGIVFLGDAPGPVGAFDVTGNIIRHNSKACPATEENPDATSGLGVANVGAHDVNVRGNIITDNLPGGDTAFSGGVVVVQGGPEGTAPADNTVKGNIILRNQPDILWDGSGTGNVFQPNLCQTSVPDGLC
jgi:hypothetical protein